MKDSGTREIELTHITFRKVYCTNHIRTLSQDLCLTCKTYVGYVTVPEYIKLPELELEGRSR
jgi:hypothetical protein